ncbi:hypothetical protein HK102_005334 [Quaeritorhiza haematococci]|nr:hypothetical protein HK102_005334 [Quaeritorhiza haematococci]
MLRGDVSMIKMSHAAGKGSLGRKDEMMSMTSPCKLDGSNTNLRTGLRFSPYSKDKLRAAQRPSLQIVTNSAKDSAPTPPKAQYVYPTPIEESPRFELPTIDRTHTIPSIPSTHAVVPEMPTSHAMLSRTFGMSLDDLTYHNRQEDESDGDAGVELKYFYMYMDAQLEDEEEICRKKIALWDGPTQEATFETISPRHISASRFPRLHTLFSQQHSRTHQPHAPVPTMRKVPSSSTITSHPSSPLTESATSTTTTPSLFQLVDLKINTQNITHPSTFRSISLFESAQYRTIQATTTVYSFGKRILETKEIRYPTLSKGRYLYHFDFVKQFFGTFFDGFKDLEVHEIEVAVENISVMQTFEDMDAAPEPKLLSCLAYEFSVGDAETEVFNIQD